MAGPIVQNVRIFNPLNTMELDVLWDQYPATILGYNVYRALSIDGTYTKLNLTPIGILQYQDMIADQKAMVIYWYKVTAQLTTSIETDFSIPVCQVNRAKITSRQDLTRLGILADMNHEKVLYEMVRRNELLLRRGGEIVDIWIRKVAGVLCSCYVPERAQPADPSCQICYGTGYVGGYEKCENTLMKIEPTTNDYNVMEMGGKLTSVQTAWITTFPLVMNGDLVVRRIDNSRYQIQAIKRMISRGILTRQEFRITEILNSEFPEIFLLGV